MSERKLGLTYLNVKETLGISYPTVVDSLFRRGSMDIYDQRLEGWARNIVGRTCASFEVRGREHLDGRAFVVMSNHASHYDIPILFHAIGTNIRMLAKQELQRVPIFGKALEESGFIFIDRKDRGAAFESLARAKKSLDAGRHIWISPEGTRSKTGELLPFKKGGFYLAQGGGFPILPVTISGTRDILSAGSVRSLGGANVVVTLHRPIDPTHFEKSVDGRKTLMDAVRAAILSVNP